MRGGFRPDTAYIRLKTSSFKVVYAWCIRISDEGSIVRAHGSDRRARISKTYVATLWTLLERDMVTRPSQWPKSQASLS